MNKSIKRKRRYRINKLKFIRFIIVSIIFLTLIIWLCSLLINAIYSIVHNHDKTISVDNITTIEYSEIIPISTEVHASKADTYDIEEINIIDYNKKPNGLKDIYYEYIIEISNIEHIPFEVILAIITTENETYDENAHYENTNGTIDMGLCQINSSYVEYFADKYDIENLDPYNVKDAITFVARHMKYLSDYAKEHYNLNDKDSYIFAAGAYNRGLGNECKYRNMYEYKEKFLINYEKFI